MKVEYLLGIISRINLSFKTAKFGTIRVGVLGGLEC